MGRHHASITTVLVLSLLLVPALSLAAKPSFPTLSEKEQAQVDQGKIVLQLSLDGEGGGFVTGLTEIAASPDEIWEILTDFESIPESTSSIKEVDRYLDVDRGGGLRNIRIGYLLKIAWVEIRYYVDHDYYPAQQYLTWKLDKAKDNGIDSTVGSFSTWPGKKPGTTYFLYQTRVDTGRSIPKWVEEDLSVSSLKKYMKYTKEKAEK